MNVMLSIFTFSIFLGGTQAEIEYGYEGYGEYGHYEGSGTHFYHYQIIK